MFQSSHDFHHQVTSTLHARWVTVGVHRPCKLEVKLLAWSVPLEPASWPAIGPHLAVPCLCLPGNCLTRPPYFGPCFQGGQPVAVTVTVQRKREASFSPDSARDTIPHSRLFFFFFNQLLPFFSVFCLLAIQASPLSRATLGKLC